MKNYILVALGLFMVVPVLGISEKVDQETEARDTEPSIPQEIQPTARCMTCKKAKEVVKPFMCSHTFCSECEPTIFCSICKKSDFLCIMCMSVPVAPSHDTYKFCAEFEQDTGSLGDRLCLVCREILEQCEARALLRTDTMQSDGNEWKRFASTQEQILCLSGRSLPNNNDCSSCNLW